MPFERKLAAAALATLAIAAAIPIPVAQLDFAGIVDVFHIDAGDTPHGVRVLAAVGGLLTIGVMGVALGGVALALLGSPAARIVLGAAALAGLLTAPPLWLPTGVVLSAAAMLLGGAPRAATA
jgi:hypothetical protein